MEQKIFDQLISKLKDLLNKDKSNPIVKDVAQKVLKFGTGKQMKDFAVNFAEYGIDLK